MVNIVEMDLTLQLTLNNARPIAEIELSSLCECKSERKCERVNKVEKDRKAEREIKTGR